MSYTWKALVGIGAERRPLQPVVRRRTIPHDECWRGATPNAGLCLLPLSR